MKVEAKDIYAAMVANDIQSSTTIERIKVLTGELRDVLQKCVAGDVHEFGCYKGSTSVPLSVTLNEAKSDKVLYLYDTFEGLPEGDEELDRKIKSNAGPLPKGTLTYSEEDFNTTFSKTMLDLCGSTGIYGTVKGDVRETVKDIGPVAFAVFDVDYHDSTRHLFEAVAPQVSLDGVIYVDDYYSWSGARKATEDFLENNKDWKGFIVRKGNPYFFIRRIG